MSWNRRQKVVFIVSNVEKSLAFEWLADALSQHQNLHFVLLNPSGSSFENFLRENNIPVKRFVFFGKKDYPKVFFQTLWYFFRVRPDIVHVHLLDAQLIGLTAAWFAGVKKRIYTRHNSNFHHVYFPKGVRYDRLSNRLATHIVSVSQATDSTLLELENVRISKIRKVHHGFDLSIFGVKDDVKIASMRDKWHISNSYPCIGVIARHIEWKGIQYVIPAFRQLLAHYPSAVLVLANAQGPYHKNVLEDLGGIPMANYTMIPFEEDVATLYALFDLYVHVPINPVCEAFGQTYVEALAGEVPCVFTKSGIAAEFVEHKENAWVVDFQNSEEIYRGMITVLQNPELQRKLRFAGKKAVQELFDIKTMVARLQNLYDE